MEFSNSDINEIYSEECIGNSRDKINTNFKTLNTSLSNLSSSIYDGSIFSNSIFLSGLASIRNIGTEGVELYKEGTQRPFEIRKLASGTPNVFVQEDQLSQSVKISVLQTSAINVGTGEGQIVSGSTAYPLNLRTIKAGSNVDINTVGNEIIVSLETPISAVNIGPGEGQIFESFAGNDIRLKTIKAGAGVIVTNESDYIQIDATGSSGTGGEANAGSNLGTSVEGTGVYAGKSGVNLQFKRLKAGSGVELIETQNSIVIESNGTGSGGISNAVNIGISTPPPVGVFKNTFGSTLRLKSVSSGYNIEVAEVNDTIQVSSPNTVSKAKDIPGSTGEASILPEPPIQERTLFTKRIRAGKDITVTNGPKDVIISNPFFVGMVAPFPVKKAPEGWLACEGQLVSRSTYSRLWEVAQDSENIVEDAVWTASGTYGSFSYGDGIGTFRLPDMRGYFVRGWDDERGVDVGRGIGTSQQDAFQGHKHGLYDPTHGHTGTATAIGSKHKHKIDMSDMLVRAGPDNEDDNGDTGFENYNGTKYTDTDGSHTHQVVVNPRVTNVAVLSPTGDQATAGSGDSNGPGGTTPRTALETRPKNLALLYCIKT